jgi:hypothetical protein
MYFFLGKDALRLGAGKHDTLHLSNSTEPFPMARLGTIKPFHTFLGYVSFLTYVGEMEAERHIPRAKFAGTRLNWSTQKRLEIGVSRSWFAGGDGQDNSISNVYWDLYSGFFKQRGGVESYSDYRNQQLVLDFRLKIPEINLVMYGEFGREDHEFNWDGVVERWDHTQAHILGLKQSNLFGDFFWIIERANNVQPAKHDTAATAWYNHHEYRSGWTYKGVCLGHHMGADAIDQFLALGYQSSLFALMLFFDEEIHGVRSRTEEGAEVKQESGLKGFWVISRHLKVEFMGMQQKYQNFGLVPGKNAEALALALKTVYHF